MEFLFWFMCVIIIYLYVGYPFLLFVMSKIIKYKPQIDETVLPTITIIVSAYNEQDVIKEKIENLLQLDYPKDMIKYFVCSDCSNDQTDDIVRSFEKDGVILIRQNERLGKSACLNKAIDLTDSEIVVFSDANSMYEPESVIKLVRNFSNSRIGYVVGRQLYKTSGKKKSNELTYWDYEIFIKKLESTISSVVGGDGAIYAIRRELYEKLEPADINDFYNPLQIIAKGYRGIFEPEAVCYEHQVDDVSREFQRKTRIVSRSFRNVLKIPQVLNPLKTGIFAIQILSHKLLRWMVPVFLVLILFSNLFLLDDKFYILFLVLQILYYLFALVGFINKGWLKFAVFSLPYYFFLVNYASFLGIIKGLRGNIQATWQPQRN
jgi:cellulose synthase/poly-beta-1,6-N-acetylglucosamine synthase-like glycosyltransferase